MGFAASVQSVTRLCSTAGHFITGQHFFCVFRLSTISFKNEQISKDHNPFLLSALSKHFLHLTVKKTPQFFSNCTQKQNPKPLCVHIKNAIKTKETKSAK